LYHSAFVISHPQNWQMSFIALPLSLSLVQSTVRLILLSLAYNLGNHTHLLAPGDRHKWPV
jgi:hypothetical protein